MPDEVSTGTAFTLDAAQVQARVAVDAMPAVLRQFRCPVCGEIFGSHAALSEHFDALHPDDAAPLIVTLHVNGKACQMLIEPNFTLHDALQFSLGLTGAKHMCNRGACGSCTVIMDGRTILSCTILAAECEGKPILTVEGIAADPKWRPLIDAYCRWDTMQCGYCTPGFLVSAKALLDKNPNPTEEDCRRALSGNICICGTYPRHGAAILEAALSMSKGGDLNA